MSHSLFKEPTNMDNYIAVDPLGRIDVNGKRDASGRWQVYTDGYKLAADLLIDNRQGIPREDILLYPIAFLYRHYLELKLKALVVKASNLSTDPVDITRLGKHNIQDLWGRLKGILKALKMFQAKDAMKEFDSCVRELSDIDPDSIAFRYSQDLSGIPTFEGLTAIDIANVKEVMGHLSILLEAISIYIDQEREWTEEMKRNEMID